MDKKNKWIITFLVIVLFVVSFYMFRVHIPYFNHSNEVKQLRNFIAQKNNLEYDDYFFEYNGQKQVYIMKAKMNGLPCYVASNDEGEIQATYSGECYDQKEIIKQIVKTFKVKEEEIGDLDVAYENSLFCYYKKIQHNQNLLYVYYNIQTGEFVKSYDLRSEQS